MPNDTRLRVLLATFLSLLIAAGVIVVVQDNGADHPPGTPRRTITVRLGGPGHKKLELPPAAQAELAQQTREDAAGQDDKAESDLHEVVPPTRDAIRQAQQHAPPGAPRIPQATTFASPSTPGCRAAFVRNSSPRPTGARVLLGVIHWTGSRPLAGLGDVNAIDRWFDTPASQASSTYITDDEGHCLYSVTETRKAWTQADFNSWAVSVEHVNQGVLPVFPTPAGRAAVVRLIRGWHARWKIPYQRARVTCAPYARVLRPGFLAHRDLGSCGGGHPDIGTPSAVDALIADARALDNRPKRAPLTKTQQHACDLLNYHRRRAHQVGRWYPSRARRANDLNKQIPAVRCPSKYRR